MTVHESLLEAPKYTHTRFLAALPDFAETAEETIASEIAAGNFMALQSIVRNVAEDCFYTEGHFVHSCVYDSKTIVQQQSTKTTSTIDWSVVWCCSLQVLYSFSSFVDY